MLALLNMVPSWGQTARAGRTIEVAVMCLNDFHGAFVRDDYKGIPGAASVVETLDSLRSVYPISMVVSAGDNFGGSYFYQTTRQHTLMPQFFQDCGISISGVGNHEFDEGQDRLLDCWRKDVECRPQSWEMQYLSANIRCDASSKMRHEGTSRPVFCSPFTVRELPVGDGRTFSVALIGMTTSSTPRQASSSKLGGLSFDGRTNEVLDSLRRLPEYSEVARANARILLTHQGTTMGHIMRGDVGLLEPVWDDADSAELSRMNTDELHGIFSSHSHKGVVGRINEHGYPITQGLSQGRVIAILKFEVDSATLQVLDVTPMLVRVSPKDKFGPKAARLQAQVDELLATTHTKGGATLGEQLTIARQSIPFNRTQMRHDQTRLGQLVCQAYAQAFRCSGGIADADQAVVVGITHIGGMRNGIQAGAVRVMDVGEVLPFDNAMRVFRVTGAELRALIDFGLHNERYGYLQFCGLTPTFNKKGHVKTMTYTLPSGRQIMVKDNTVCYIVADEFISNGGDGYDASLFPAAKELHGLQMPHITDAFINFLKTQESI